ncbi:hypothetical protein HYH03_008504 [Edaphochlamys debaryana]|uniref:Uncharacterized protein n=1 Tax=Edaphochlamys debaryana TaxID=47281 RepID=A0A835Y181_9CHLO|nr:hypothetical protein HYH03_008504 [Edaphochlamys debaryana]|eukprot:KAG2493372.1 hypothetical protein HYH03_008504 [Edaphochlamys debaryana]
MAVSRGLAEYCQCNDTSRNAFVESRGLEAMQVALTRGSPSVATAAARVLGALVGTPHGLRCVLRWQSASGQDLLGLLAAAAAGRGLPSDLRSECVDALRSALASLHGPAGGGGMDLDSALRGAKAAAWSPVAGGLLDSVVLPALLSPNLHLRAAAAALVAVAVAEGLLPGGPRSAAPALAAALGLPLLPAAAPLSRDGDGDGVVRDVAVPAAGKAEGAAGEAGVASTAVVPSGLRFLALSEVVAALLPSERGCELLQALRAPQCLLHLCTALRGRQQRGAESEALLDAVLLCIRTGPGVPLWGGSGAEAEFGAFAAGATTLAAELLQPPPPAGGAGGPGYVAAVALAAALAKWPQVMGSTREPTASLIGGLCGLVCSVVPEATTPDGGGAWADAASISSWGDASRDYTGEGAWSGRAAGPWRPSGELAVSTAWRGRGWAAAAAPFQAQAASTEARLAVEATAAMLALLGSLGWGRGQAQDRAAGLDSACGASGDADNCVGNNGAAVSALDAQLGSQVARCATRVLAAAAAQPTVMAAELMAAPLEALAGSAAPPAGQGLVPVLARCCQAVDGPSGRCAFLRCVGQTAAQLAAALMEQEWGGAAHDGDGVGCAEAAGSAWGEAEGLPGRMGHGNGTGGRGSGRGLGAREQRACIASLRVWAAALEEAGPCACEELGGAVNGRAAAAGEGHACIACAVRPGQEVEAMEALGEAVLGALGGGQSGAWGVCDTLGLVELAAALAGVLTQCGRARAEALGVEVAAAVECAAAGLGDVRTAGRASPGNEDGVGTGEEEADAAAELAEAEAILDECLACARGPGGGGLATGFGGAYEGGTWWGGGVL